MLETLCSSKFDAHEWARTFMKAGAKYVTITSRHHDGFSKNQPVARDRPVEQCDVIQKGVWGYKINERGEWMAENGEAIYATRGLGLVKNADDSETAKTLKLFGRLPLTFGKRL